jgi:hypothetical protein
MDSVEQEYGPRLTVFRHDITKDEAAFDAYVDRLDVIGAATTPKLAVFLAEQPILGGEAIHRELQPKLNALLTTPPAAVTAEASVAPSANRSPPIDRTRWPLVTAAGLADGINPCTFATAILFIALLQARRRRREELIKVGGAFILAVYLTYLAIGLLFYQAMTVLAHLHTLGLVIGWGAAGLALLAGMLSAVDALRSLKPQGQARMILVLPTRLKRAIKSRLRITASTGQLMASAFIAGALIALLESACTGQVYFPLILGLVREDAQLHRGLLLLLLYNGCFILPLLLLFAAALVGVSSERVAGVFRRKLWVSKLGLAAVFLTLGIWLAATLV